MSDVEYWTEQQVSDYCGGCPAVATLRTKRTRGGGPPFIKRGRFVLYPAEEAKKWAAGNGPQTHTYAK